MPRAAKPPVADIRQRLQSGAATLAVIDYRREKTHDPSVGVGIEHWIIDRELRDLEASPQSARGRRARLRRRRSRVLLVKARWLLRRASLKKRASR